MPSQDLQISEYTRLGSNVVFMNWAAQSTKPNLVFDMDEISAKSREKDSSHDFRMIKFLGDLICKINAHEI